MLRRFHAMNSVKAHPTLPQSDSEPVADIVLVHLGYAIVLRWEINICRDMATKNLLVMHVLIPTLSDVMKSVI